MGRPFMPCSLRHSLVLLSGEETFIRWQMGTEHPLSQLRGCIGRPSCVVREQHIHHVAEFWKIQGLLSI
jgi:hypothetical protein